RHTYAYAGDFILSCFTRPLSRLSICLFVSRDRRPRRSTLFPYTTLFRSLPSARTRSACRSPAQPSSRSRPRRGSCRGRREARARSEEHTSELQSRSDLVCRLLLEKITGLVWAATENGEREPLGQRILEIP